MDEIEAYLEIWYQNDGTMYMMWLRLKKYNEKVFFDDIKYGIEQLKLEKKWLKSLIKSEPTLESKENIVYKFEWGEISDRVVNYREDGFGTTGIQIKYKE